MNLDEILQDLAITFSLPNTQGTKFLLNFYKNNIEKILKEKDEEIIALKKKGGSQ